MRMLSALKETIEAGLSRIEITYYADSIVAEQQLLVDGFSETMHKHLDQVQEALNLLDGVCYKVPLLDVLETFQNMCKQHQLYVQMPHVCALIFARNSRNGF